MIFNAFIRYFSFEPSQESIKQVPMQSPIGRFPADDNVLEVPIRAFLGHGPDVAYERFVVDLCRRLSDEQLRVSLYMQVKRNDTNRYAPLNVTADKP